FVAGTWTLAAVFLGRIVGDFRGFGLFKRMRGTAFAWWDTWLFVPLCLLLALGCLVAALSEHRARILRAVSDGWSYDRVSRSTSDGALARSDCLLLPSHARLVVVLPLAQFVQDTSLLALFLEATDGAVDRLLFACSDP